MLGVVRLRKVQQKTHRYLYQIDRMKMLGLGSNPLVAMPWRCKPHLKQEKSFDYFSQELFQDRLRVLVIKLLDE